MIAVYKYYTLLYRIELDCLAVQEREAGNKSGFQQQVSIPSIIFAPLIRYPIESISYLLGTQQVGGTRPGKTIHRFTWNIIERVRKPLSFQRDQESSTFNTFQQRISILKIIIRDDLIFKQLLLFNIYGYF